MERARKYQNQKKILENQIPKELKWLMLGRKPHYQRYCPTNYDLQDVYNADQFGLF